MFGFNSLKDKKNQNQSSFVKINVKLCFKSNYRMTKLGIDEKKNDKNN